MSSVVYQRQPPCDPKTLGVRQDQQREIGAWIRSREVQCALPQRASVLELDYICKPLFLKENEASPEVFVQPLRSAFQGGSDHAGKPLQNTSPAVYQDACTTNGLPWKIVIIIDSTLQHRASLYPENAKTFNHGKGYVIGHQWTNIVLVLGDMLIPLRPIPFYSKRYCQTHDLTYQSEHERVVEYLRMLDLEDYMGSYDRREVLVLADSGYDNKKIEKAIGDKGWHFIIALGKTRSVKSQALSLTTPHSQQWCHIDTFFRRHRRLKWHTIRLATNGNKRKRMDVRVRHTSALCAT